MNEQTWNAEDYAQNNRFVPELGQPVFDLLAPRAGERILDLGCGDGALTQKLAEAGADVLGVDLSPEFIAACAAHGLKARLMDAHDMPFAGEFDAVFSNAALHWMKDIETVLDQVHRALRKGGRFVGEFGGHACLAAICTALRAVLARRGVKAVLPWYFPAAAAFQAQLEGHNFEVDFIALIPRPTVLPAGLPAWLRTFAQPILSQLPETEQQPAEQEVVELLRPALCDTSGNWTADYTRLRFAAHSSGANIRQPIS